MSALAVRLHRARGRRGRCGRCGTARFMFPNILSEPPSKFKVGFPERLRAGQVETKFKAQFGVWIVNTEYRRPSRRSSP